MRGTEGGTWNFGNEAHLLAKDKVELKWLWPVLRMPYFAFLPRAPIYRTCNFLVQFQLQQLPLPDLDILPPCRCLHRQFTPPPPADMAQKRSRTTFETDITSPYVIYGTPLPPLDPDIRDDGTYVPIWKQEVTDERGRKRLHGAFTGGFSAG